MEKTCYAFVVIELKKHATFVIRVWRKGWMILHRA